MSKLNSRIEASEKSLSFSGVAEDALNLVADIRMTYEIAGVDMPKMLNDFVFNMEVALQRAGVMEGDFAPTR